MGSTRIRYEFGPFLLDPEERCLWRRDQDLPISPKLFEVLLFLVRNSDHLLTKDALMGGIWPDTVVEESNLARHISSLRALLNDNPAKPTFIETVPWRGYRFIAPVRKIIKGESPESIAVLPLMSEGLAYEAEYMPHALVSALVEGLSRDSGLKVVSSHAVLRYLAEQEDGFPDLSAAGRELGVQAVVTGRIFGSGGRISVDVELVDTLESGHMWGSQYACSFENFLNVADWILKDLSERLSLNILARGERTPRAPTSFSEEALLAYRKGRFFVDKVTPEGVQRGMEFFQQALREDPAFALAHVGLMRCHNSLGNPVEARKAARRALALDPNLGEAHAALAFNLFLYEWDWAGADREFIRALELSPRYAEAHHWYAIYLAHLGEYDRALHEARQAKDLEPLSLPMSQTIGNVLCLARDYDRAIRSLQETLELDQNYLAARSTLGLCYAEKGLCDRAIEQFRTVQAKVPEASPAGAALRAFVAYAWATAGRKAEARRGLGELVHLPQVPPYQIALIHARLGDRDATFAWLTRAYRARSIELVGLRTSPALDGFRSDPRFLKLSQKVGPS